MINMNWDEMKVWSWNIEKVFQIRKFNLYTKYLALFNSTAKFMASNLHLKT